MGLADPDANNLLDAKFRGDSLDVPASYDVGFSSTKPEDDGTGVTEPTDPDYARANLPTDSATWNAAAARQIDTAIDLEWPDPASVDWEDLAYWTLHDPVSGDLRYYGRLSSVFTVAAGTRARIFAGEIWIRIPASTLTL